MVFPKTRLVVSALLFLAWIGFLAFLVVHMRDPVILSRPQLNVADLIVLAEIAAKEGRPADEVAVQKMVHSNEQNTARIAGMKVSIAGLSEIGPVHGWSGPGLYILPLSKKNDNLEVTALPPSPGFPRTANSNQKDRRIYRATPDALAQLKEIGF
jgi:hypothetical protein